ncbi:hypothetical protein HD597_010076 [Nonomuraea thailandensis]|uniref:Uncharacterized protein n=1 Tax=Nonomuraea thailandensis TaxID=1188745 RepID=A0A9X2KAK6_9ACTN|nr:hypothetical protein [Nonomuraea thailandensis]MCP2363056.1 hypothetical protein [Nonomuraea thailandensis]
MALPTVRRGGYEVGGCDAKGFSEFSEVIHVHAPLGQLDLGDRWPVQFPATLSDSVG